MQRTIRFNRDITHGGPLTCTVHFEYEGQIIQWTQHQVGSVFSFDANALGSADPILEQCTSAFYSTLKGAYSRTQWYRTTAHLRRTLVADDIMFIVSFPTSGHTAEVIISKKGSSYSINGITMARKQIAPVLARILLDLNAKSKRKVMTYRDCRNVVTSAITVPEDIRYVLTSRLPYTYYREGNTVQVRLKVMQISDDDYAIEISSNVWGKISSKNLLTLIGFYRHGKKVGNWKFLSPKTLFERLVGREPTDSEVKLMHAFLEQNRSEKLVQERAMTLLDDLLKQYPTRVIRNDCAEMIRIIVLGKSCDWLLTGSKESLNRVTIGPQAVATRTMLNETSSEGEGFTQMKWGSSICINTGGKNPSLGDQFASRILSLLNDTITIGRVSTLSSYLHKEKPRLVFENLKTRHFASDFNGDVNNELLRMPVEEV